MLDIAQYVWDAANTFIGIAPGGVQFLGLCQIRNLADVLHAAICVIIVILIRARCQKGIQYRRTTFAALANCNVYKV